MPWILFLFYLGLLAMSLLLSCIINLLCFSSFSSTQSNTTSDCCPFAELDDPELDIAALTAANRISNGPYDIVNCDSSERVILYKYIDYVRAYANHTVRDAQKGIKSTHGFWALFKSDDNRQFVTDVFESIANGAPTYPSAANGEYRPTLLCASEHSPDIPETVHQNCAWGPTANYVSTDHSNVIIVCPEWWEQRREAPLQCPHVLRNGKMMPPGMNLADHKIGILIHELAHVYVGLRAPEDFPERYRLEECVNLSKEESIENASSYAFYASCRYDILLSMFVDCSSMPLQR